MIRVDHAGEYGAARIYRGQLDVLGDRHPMTGPIRLMEEQERAHLETFDQLINERGVRPTALGPVWHAAGYALGAATALMGPRAAMACTAAVENVIDEHYASQLEELGDDEADLRETIAKFRAEEAEHRTTAIAHGAEQTPGYNLMAAGIKTGCRLAIWLSKRV
ncbi:MAG: demethoxyubiquinone hydroxylase family protein [Sphingomonadales bacterium]